MSLPQFYENDAVQSLDSKCTILNSVNRLSPATPLGIEREYPFFYSHTKPSQSEVR